MAHRRVLVQLDDDVVERLDELAVRLGVSRSQLLRRGALAVLEADRIKRADRAPAAACQRAPQDPLIVASAGRLAGETTPVW